MTRHDLIEVAQACAARFGSHSPAGVYLQALHVCFASDVEREAAALSSYWAADPRSVDVLLCDGDCALVAVPAHEDNAARAFTKLSRCLPLPSDPAGKLIKTLLHSPQSVR